VLHTSLSHDAEQKLREPYAPVAGALARLAEASTSDCPLRSVQGLNG
jgi:hypothetical protein